MALRKLFDSSSAQMRVAGFMSGSGTNLRKIIEHEKKLEKERSESPFKIVVIFTDNASSKALEIGKDYDIPVIARDIRAFYAKRGRPRKDMNLRKEFDKWILEALKPFSVDIAAFAGYMSVASNVLVENLVAINVHPADLSIKNENGKRKFKGDHAVRDAILAGEKTIASTTHIVEEGVDEGRLLLISSPVEVEKPDSMLTEHDIDLIANHNQEILKQKGDWIIFPLTLQFIAEGRFQVNESGIIHFDGKPIPDGIRIEDINLS